jgi:xylose isomerase
MREHLRMAACYWHTFVWPGRTCLAWAPSSARGSAARADGPGHRQGAGGL